MKSTKQGAKKDVTAGMALEMLESAIGYLQRAGVMAEALNGEDGALHLRIPGACVLVDEAGGTAKFEITPEGGQSDDNK
jgi:hypothetical protein